MDGMIMTTEQKLEAIKEIIKDSPELGLSSDKVWPEGSKVFNDIDDLIVMAGYKLEAHQRGIAGTFLALIPDIKG